MNRFMGCSICAVKLFNKNSSSTSTISISMEMDVILYSFVLPEIIKVIKDACDTSAQEVLRQIFPSIDDIWLNEKDKGFDVCKFVPRSLRIIFGEIHFRYRQAKKDRKYYRPLLETLGIDAYQRITEDLMDLVKRSALYTSYRKARDDAVYYYLEGEPAPPLSSLDFATVMIDEIWLCKKTKKIQTVTPEKRKSSISK